MPFSCSAILGNFDFLEVKIILFVVRFLRQLLDYIYSSNLVLLESAFRQIFDLAISIIFKNCNNCYNVYDCPAVDC